MPRAADLRDDFADNLIAAAWTTIVTGSATAAETSGQARCTLPSSTAGSHQAYFRTVSTYDLTSDSWYINIDTMVSTAVAATMTFDVFLDGTNILRWQQLSGTLKAQTIVAGVTTDQYSVAWSASTYKYLRIRNSGTDILFESSSNGTSWTTRATVALSGLFAITALKIQFGASCGNVASPGSLRLEDVNLILPALSTTWRWTQIVWPLANRHKVVTLALDTVGTAQGYVVTADGVDVSGDPSGNVRYWSGPADGGRLLTEQASDAAAKAIAVNIPLDGRFDLPTIIEARCIRVYHRSIDGSAYTMREIYPRRLVQADDIEAEFIRGLTVSGHQFITDQLSAFTSNIGQLTITNPTGDAWIYQGTGTGDAPTTGLKIYNVGGIGKLSTYNATVEQVSLDTDGVLKAGAGTVRLDENGVELSPGSNASPISVNSVRWRSTADGGGTSIGKIYAQRSTVSSANDKFGIYRSRRDNSHVTSIELLETIMNLSIDSGTTTYSFDTTTATFQADLAVTGGLNLGSATGAGAGVLKTSSQIVAGSSITASAGDINAAAGVFRVAGTLVVGARKTGWAAATNTKSRATFDTTTVTTAQLAARVGALVDDLLSHGLIGA